MDLSSLATEARDRALGLAGFSASRRPDLANTVGQARNLTMSVAQSLVGGGSSQAAPAEAEGSGISRFFQGVGDFIGGGIRGIGRAAGAVVGGATRVVSNVVAGGLDLVGSPEAAARVRSAGQTASRVLERGLSAAGDAAGNFVSGVADGVGGLADGVVTMVTHPIQTLQAVGRIADAINPVTMISEAVQGRDPLGKARELVGGVIDSVREDYARTGRDHGTAGQAGRLSFDVLSTLLTGGSSSAGRVSTRVVANSLDDFARASRAAEVAGDATRAAGAVNTAGDAARAASGAQATAGAASGSGRLAQAAGDFVGRRMNGPLRGVADRITRTAESARGALTSRYERRFQENIATGEARLAERGLRGQEGRDILESARHRANGLRDELPRTDERWARGGADREALLDSLPEATQQRARELQAAGRSDEALQVVKRHQAEEAIRASLDDVGRVDELYNPRGELPADVAPEKVLASGRRSSLEHLLGDARVDADGLRRSFRHLVDDSDLTGSAYLERFAGGDQVGRAFSSSAGRESGIGSRSSATGGYYGSVDDARRSSSQIRAGNALPGDNHADRFATFTIPEDTYGVVTRIGEKYEFGGHAVGGSRQINFPRYASLENPEISKIGRFSDATHTVIDRSLTGAGAFGQWVVEDEEQ